MKGCRYVILLIIIVFLLIPISINSVNGFGVATPYFENDTIMLEPGQTFDYTIKIQNNDDISFDVQIDYDSDVAVLNSKEFFIPAKSYDNAFTFIITIPNISSPGDKYSLNYNAKPIMNISGQVPMNVEIKKSVSFITVKENGQGYFITKPTNIDRIKGAIIGILKASYIYLIIIIVLATTIFVGIRLWKISTKITQKINAPYTINDAKSTQELFVLIKMMNNKQFDNEFIRNMYSDRFKALKEQFLSNKVLTASRREMLETLK